MTKLVEEILIIDDDDELYLLETFDTGNGTFLDVQYTYNDDDDDDENRYVVEMTIRTKKGERLKSMVAGSGMIYYGYGNYSRASRRIIMYKDDVPVNEVTYIVE